MKQECFLHKKFQDNKSKKYVKMLEAWEFIFKMQSKKMRQCFFFLVTKYNPFVFQLQRKIGDFSTQKRKRKQFEKS